MSTPYIPEKNDPLTALDNSVTPLTDSATQMPTDLGAAFAKMFLTLFVLVILLGISYWFLRRLIQNRWQRGSAHSAIQILEKRMISPKTMLYLLELEGKKILIAESQLEVKRLAEDLSRGGE